MDLTPADVEQIESHIRGGGSFRSVTLSFAKSMGLENYRKEHPEWSREMLDISRSNFSAATTTRFARRNESRSHCSFGHELTSDVLDRELAAASVGWNPRACRLCCLRLDSVGRFLAEQVDLGPTRAAPKKVPVGIVRRTHCKYGHALTPENIVVEVMFNGHKHHQCRICVNLTDDDADEIMKHLRADTPLKRVPLPALKTLKSIKRYREDNPAWDSIVSPLIKANSLAARIAGSKRVFGNSTRCGNGHEFTPENTYWKSSNGTRQCRTCNKLRAREGAPVTPEKIELAKRAILTGMTVSDIVAAGRKVSGRRSIMTPPQWRKARIAFPDFNRFILENIQSKRSFGVMQRAGGLAPIQDLARLATLEFDAQDPSIPVYVPQPRDPEWIYSLTPRYLSPDDRYEIVGDLFLELSARTLRREDVPARVKELVRKRNREFPTHAYGDIRSPLSLDAPAYLDGTMLRVETVSETLWERI